MLRDTGCLHCRIASAVKFRTQLSRRKARRGACEDNHKVRGKGRGPCAHRRTHHALQPMAHHGTRIYRGACHYPESVMPRLVRLCFESNGGRNIERAHAHPQEFGYRRPKPPSKHSTSLHSEGVPLFKAPPAQHRAPARAALAGKKSVCAGSFLLLWLIGARHAFMVSRLLLHANP